MANLHPALTAVFNQAYWDHQPDAFIELVRHHLPDIVPAKAPLHYTPGPQGLTLTAGPIQLVISESFGLRLYAHGQELTTNRDHIPMQYPWFQPDPADPDNVAEYAMRHVARGFRGESPWPESQWPQIGGVVQGAQHWPHRDVAFGPYSLALVESATANTVLVSQLNPTQPNAYGVINRGLFTLTQQQGLLMAVQLENLSDLAWAPWLVLGFAVPREGTRHNPSTLLAIPDSIYAGPVTNALTKTWNYTTLAGQTVALINPQTKTLNEPYKQFYADVNWTALAIKGADAIVLTRSLLHHPEQFFPFLEHGQYFVEVEHTGPLVTQGETSTVVVRVDVLPLAALTDGKLDQFSHHQFEADVRSVLGPLLEQQGRWLCLA
jgi:hypothetical protein